MQETPSYQNYISGSLLVITIVFLKEVNDLASFFRFIFTEWKTVVSSENLTYYVLLLLCIRIGIKMNLLTQY